MFHNWNIMLWSISSAVSSCPLVTTIHEFDNFKLPIQVIYAVLVPLEWLISLSITSSRFIRVTENDRIPYLKAMFTPHFLYLFFHWLALPWQLCSGYEDNATVNKELQIISLRTFSLVFKHSNIKASYSAKKKNMKRNRWHGIWTLWI